jgi:hypothetical protein
MLFQHVLNGLLQPFLCSDDCGIQTLNCKEEITGMETMDYETTLKSLYYLMESVEHLIGANGAKAVLRTAGQRAAANLIEMLPLAVPESEVVKRTCPLLVELGFVNEMKETGPDTVQICGNNVIRDLESMGLQSIISGQYYLIGLFEGFIKQMSDSKRKVVSVEVDGECETWKLN